MSLNPFKSLLKLIKTVSYKGNRAGHVTIDTPSINTNTNVIVFNCLLSQDSNVISFTTSCRSVHYHNHRFLTKIWNFPQPIQRYVSSVREKYSFSFKGKLNTGRVYIIKRLKVVIGNKWSGPVMRLLRANFEGKN